MVLAKPHDINALAELCGREVYQTELSYPHINWTMGVWRIRYVWISLRKLSWLDCTICFLCLFHIIRVLWDVFRFDYFEKLQIGDNTEPASLRIYCKKNPDKYVDENLISFLLWQIPLQFVMLPWLRRFVRQVKTFPLLYSNRWMRYYVWFSWNIYIGIHFVHTQRPHPPRISFAALSVVRPPSQTHSKVSYLSLPLTQNKP